MQLIDRFLEFEKNNQLLEKNWNGFYYWGFVRLDLFREIERKLEGKANTGATIKKKHSPLTILKQIVNSKKRSPYRIKKHIDILFINHERRMMLDGEYKPVYFYSILDNINSSFAIIEPSNIFGEHYNPEAYLNESFYFDEFNYNRRIKSLFKRRFPYRSEIENIVGLLEKTFCTKLDANSIVNSIFKRWISYKYGKKYFTKLLKTIKPKHIVEVVHYNLYSLIINEVAHELKIPVSELQHGGMGYTHIAYNYYDKMELPYLPDKILLYSNFWKEQTRFPLQDDNIIAVGYPHMDNMIKQFGNKKHDTEDLVILFVSQRSLGRKMSLFAIDLAKKLGDEGIKGRIIYKLHPNEVPSWKEDLPELAQGYGSNIEVIDNAEKNIYEYYALSDIQIGVSSTGIYEGLAFDLQTFVLKLPGWEVAEPLCSSGFAHLVSSPEDVISKMKDKKEVQRDFWMHDSVNNILKELHF